MKAACAERVFYCQHTAEIEPEWKHRVDRWYQLDAAAYSLVAAFWNWRNELTARPDLLILAAPQASNEIDAQFAASTRAGGVGSPQKFVHTLPSIRSAALCQIMDWSGPVLCLQNGQDTIVDALREAADFAAAGLSRVWVMSVERSHVVRLFEFDCGAVAPHLVY